MTFGPRMQISPDSPCAKLLPASSLIWISILGRGKPIVPVNALLVTGLFVPMATVSLMPQPSTMGLPVAANHALAVPSVAAIPPACDKHNVEKSKVLNDGVCSNALNSVFTAGNM